ncbi:MAG TPA: DUF1330 domain-containing protein [Xanthobacteraceae bacterium]|jgi:uncharacterized protein (DUF1330 family)
MKMLYTVGPAMLAGAVIGAAAINGLQAQNRAHGAYVIIDISNYTDRDTFMRQMAPGATVDPYNGKFLTRSEKITAIDGTPPKRFVIIGFDSLERAKAWDASAAQKDADSRRQKFTTSRAFIVEAEGAN